MSDHHAADIDKHVRSYLLVFAALLVLTVITVAVYYLHLPVAASIALALFIASVKGSLVACYFMHLISEKKLIYTLLIITVAFFIPLLLLPVLTSLWDQVGSYVSLKSFHVVLISLSSLLAVGFGAWSVRAYSAGGQVTHLVAAVASFAVAVGLVLYVVWFARKIRSREEEERRRRRLIRPLLATGAGWLLSTRAAEACSVCYGDASGPMIDAARLGVWLLFGLVLTMQLAFVLFFLCLRKRARDLAGRPGLESAHGPGGEGVIGP